MSIIKRKAAYGVRIWDPKVKAMRWVGTYSTRAEAKDAEARATLTPRRGRPITVAEFAAMWASDYAREAAATRSTYRYAAQRIVNDIGDSLIADLDRPAARKIANVWPRNTTRVARTMFGDAMRDGLIDFNPFGELRLETPKGRKDLDALTEPQIHQLAEIAERIHGPEYGPDAAAIILTFAYVGLRPGELCSVRRADLNVRDMELTIRWNTDASGQEKAPKNGKPRVVTVPPPALAAIVSLPERIDRDARLFYSYRGRPFYKGTLAYFWRPIGVAWREAGNKPITLYHLRHACATLLLARGVSVGDVAHQLGHSDGGALVMRLYGHPEAAGQRDRLKMAFANEPTAHDWAVQLRKTSAGDAA